MSESAIQAEDLRYQQDYQMQMPQKVPVSIPDYNYNLYTINEQI